MNDSIIAISSQTFQKLMDRLDSIERIAANQQKKENEWIDTPEVCKLLNVSKRSVENYKGKILPFSKFGGKVYFKRSDINDHLTQNYIPVRQNSY